MSLSPKIYCQRLWERWVEILGKRLTLGLAIGLAALTLVAAFGMFNTAPPNTLTLSAGPKGSSFMRYAERYQKTLEKAGVKLVILPSEGSAENLTRLATPGFHVDVGFVQSGLAKGEDHPGLQSLGSVNYQPLFLFYRSAPGEAPKELLAQFAGKKLVLGPEGSGVHKLALDLLKANDITPGGATQLFNTDDEEAAAALHKGQIDALFLMGESASIDVIKNLQRDPAVRLFSFAQADAYVRRIRYLNKLELPRGGIDLGLDIPHEAVHLLGPTIELIARPDLHPALSDLLLDAAREAHGSAGLYRKRGEFPAPLEQEFTVSEDARRYYKDGKSFLYRHLPFWLARTASALLTVLLPILVLLIPVLRYVPVLYRWSVQSRIYRWYGLLLKLERELAFAGGAALSGEQRQDLLRRVDHIEHGVANMKMPAAYADLFYALRGHIDFVRARLKNPA